MQCKDILFWKDKDMTTEQAIKHQRVMESAAKLRAAGYIQQQCNRCGGTGGYASRCASCDGEKVSWVVPAEVRAEPEARTVKAHIAVAVDPDGNWCAYGATGNDPESDQLDARVGVPGDGEAVFWVTAELPIPGAPPEVKGKVEP